MAGEHTQDTPTTFAQETRARINRRRFLASAGVMGATALAMGCGDATDAYVDAATQPEIDTLNFVLNLEYLQATLYSYVVTGKDLDSAYTGGGPTPTGAPGQLTFPNQQIADLFAESYFDELSHVSALRTAIGQGVTIARPQLNLAAIASITASNIIPIARLLADVAATAYAGVIQTLTTDANAKALAQILAVEGFHAGALRLLAIQQNSSYPYTPADGLDIKPGDPGSVALAQQGPTTANGGFFATAANGVPGQTNTFNGFAYQRTKSQTLAILYNNATAGTAKGFFFPNGVNGNNTTV
ncbi:MAG: ferritin-like domain-containing protein [Terriglobus sp.]